MELHSRLVHAEPGQRVVQVEARRNGQRLGSALGEGTTAEQAEDRALERLQRRLGAAPEPAPPAPPAPPAAAPAPAPAQVPPPVRRPPAAPAPPATAPTATAAPDTAPDAVTAGGAASGGAAAGPEPPPPQEPAPDPEDWSGELAAIDRELQRLGWGREQESIYLERAFGHPSRSRLTTYADLLAYLRALEGLRAGEEPAEGPVPLRRRDLLLQSDQLLAQLGWGPEQGRTFLEQRLGASSRQQLRDDQLLTFNLLLEEALLEAGG